MTATITTKYLGSEKRKPCTCCTTKGIVHNISIGVDGMIIGTGLCGDCIEMLLESLKQTVAIAKVLKKAKKKRKPITKKKRRKIV